MSTAIPHFLRSLRWLAICLTFAVAACLIPQAGAQSQNAPAPGAQGSAGTGQVSWQPPAQHQPYTVPNAEVRQIRTASGAVYQLMISWPEGDPPPQGFPVIYALDGNAVFGTLTESVRRITRPYGQGERLPAPIVVAIGYPDTIGVHPQRRALDYTPPAPLAPGAQALRIDGPQGGADQFLAAIRDEIQPLLARDYPIDRNHQVLAGHSLGGLFVLHALFTQPELFQTYVAISPSIWWNDRHILTQAERFLVRAKADAGAAPLRARLFLSLGEREQGGARSAAPDGQGSMAQALSRQLQGGGLPGLQVSFRVHEGESHGSVVPIALARALPQALQPPEIPSAQADTAFARKSVEELLAPFPAPGKGQTRWVIDLPPRADESHYKVELLPGKILRVDCNQHWAGATITQEDLRGWGYQYHVLKDVMPVASTMMACPGVAPQDRYVPVGAVPELQRYNSRLPIVFYTPDDVSLRYRVWRVDGDVREAVAQ